MGIPVLKIKDKEGNWVPIKAIKGENAKINGKNAIDIEAGNSICIEETETGIRINFIGTEIDKLESQIIYTAMMTNTLMEEE